MTHECEVCGKVFSQKGHYESHQRRKRPCKAAPTPICYETKTCEDVQDTGKQRTNMKEQFYTDESVAIQCIQHLLSALPVSENYLWIEPSAGNGAFLHNVPNHIQCVGIDIDPKAPDIQQGDFLKWTPPKTNQNIVIFGNPPFGRQSTIAKSFISRSCKFATIIAFILPKSFVKPSMYNAFDTHFHLVSSTELAKNSFRINDNKYDVPCVFQIWIRRETHREIDEKVAPCGFQYVKHTEPYDIALRRVGGLAGKCYPNNGTIYSQQSHYFLRFDAGFNDSIYEKINMYVFPSNTVGPRSLSKSEVSSVLNSFIV
jgi:hypothetical protein